MKRILQKMQHQVFESLHLVFHLDEDFRKSKYASCYRCNIKFVFKKVFILSSSIHTACLTGSGLFRKATAHAATSLPSVLYDTARPTSKKKTRGKKNKINVVSFKKQKKRQNTSKETDPTQGIPEYASPFCCGLPSIPPRVS